MTSHYGVGSFVCGDIQYVLCNVCICKMKTLVCVSLYLVKGKTQ